MRRQLPRAPEQLRGLVARGLVRESTKKQGENSGPIVQRSAAYAYASRWGLELAEVENADPGAEGFDGAFYTDFVSGSKASRRPQFQRMVADAEGGAFDVLLVYDTSRFARERREAAIYEQRLHEAGVIVVYIETNDLSSADQQVGQAVHSALSHEFLTLHGGKVQKAYRVKRYEVGKWSGTVPIGYRMAYETIYNKVKGGSELVETGKLVLDTEPQPRIGFGATYTRADLVRLIGETYASGILGFRPLAAHMNLLGYRNTLGEPFSGSSIRVIVSNPVYVGQVGWHPRPDKERKAHNFHDTEWKQGEHEPIWNESLWQAINAVQGTVVPRLKRRQASQRLPVPPACRLRPLRGEPLRRGPRSGAGVVYGVHVAARAPCMRAARRALDSTRGPGWDVAGQSRYPAGLAGGHRAAPASGSSDPAPRC